jgi:hypothetical protein
MPELKAASVLERQGLSRTERLIFRSAENRDALAASSPLRADSRSWSRLLLRLCMEQRRR